MPVRISVDERVELISIIFRLAGNSEYCQCRVPAYDKEIQTWFEGAKNHPVVKLASRLRQERGVSYDAPMSLSVHLVEGLSLVGRVPLSPLPGEIDDRWTPEDLGEFCSLARDFVKDTRFGEFFKAHSPLYRASCHALESVLSSQADLSWFSDFFGSTRPVDYRVILGMANGGCCYGARFVASQGTEIYSILGVGSVDGKSSPVFGRGDIPTIIHEFGHSYTNPLVDAALPQLASDGQFLFSYVMGAMGSQAYGNWETMMRESLVRATVVRYLLARGSKDEAEKEIASDFAREFVWIRELVEKMGEYEKDRKTYPTFESFMPEIVRFFGEFAREFEKEERKRPHVVALDPENHARRVDPALKEIKVTFDRPMKPGFSFCGGGEEFPESPKGKGPFWASDKKTCIMPVRLKPRHTYRMGLNSIRFRSFESEEGLPLRPEEYSFSTGAGKNERVVIPKVVSMKPSNGATDVDPALNQIEVTFDVPMGSGLAWCGGEGFPDTPEGKKAFWTDDRKTCILPVKLAPGEKYLLFLNTDEILGFESAEGEPLDPVSYTFSTRAR